MNAPVGSKDFVRTMSRLYSKLDQRAALLKEISAESAKGGVRGCMNIGDLKPNHVNDKRAYYRGEYLKSDHWKDLKARKLKDCPNCERCCSVEMLDVHHLQYKSLFDVELCDLLTLCRKCHIQEHKQNGSRKSPQRIIGFTRNEVGETLLRFSDIPDNLVCV